MVRIARRVQPQTLSPTDPGYQAGQDPTTRFFQPLLADWSPQNQSPHTETVEVYTNAEEVELFLNNKSLGTQLLHADASPINYQIPFTPGTLRAEARTKNKLTATDTLRTALEPARILLEAFTYPNAVASRYPDPSRSGSSRNKKLGASASRYPDPSGSGSSGREKMGLQPLGHALTPNPNDAAFIIATLVDKNGTRIPTNEIEITFSVSQPGVLIATDSGNLQDHTPYTSPTRKLYDGNTTATLRTTASHGVITITATTRNLLPATITLPIAQAPPSSQRSY